MTLLGLSLAIDNHIVDDDAFEYPAVEELRGFYRERLIRLSVTDVTGTELLDAPIQKRADLQAKAANYSEYLGPAVIGHSRVGHSVLGSHADRERLHRVFELVRKKPWPQGRKQDRRDAMNIATAIRYGLDGFVTREKRLLKAAPSIRAAFNGFRVLSPDEAVASVRKRLARDEWRRRNPRPEIQ